MTALTHHGGRIDAAARAFPDAPGPWIDLSTGINPFAWDGFDRAAVDLRALPSPALLADLEAVAGAAFGATDIAVAALPGTEIGLRLLACIDLPIPIRFVAPTYRTYGETLAAATPIGLAEVDAAAGQGGTLVLANPNNPDGRILAPERLIALTRRLRERGGLVIVDEAFADMDPAISVLPHLSADDPVLVFRSFGKFFGLAGVRLGFACGSGKIVDQLRERLGSWPVSSTALAIGTAAYRDAGWTAATRVRIAASAAALDAVLAGHGLRAVGDCPLFRLVETDATPLFGRLARAGILTRPFDYAPRWLRLGLPADDRALERLDRALGNG